MNGRTNRDGIAGGRALRDTDKVRGWVPGCRWRVNENEAGGLDVARHPMPPSRFVRFSEWESNESSASVASVTAAVV